MVEDVCQQCGGSGLIYTPDPDRGVITSVTCKCTLKQRLLANLERAHKGLSKASVVPTSSLLTQTKQDLWITAESSWFWSHLKHVMLRQQPNWFVQVSTDSELLAAWLATVALGAEIYDADVRDLEEKRRSKRVSTRHVTLMDLAQPPDLLIIRLGVKAARNQAMPEVLLETLTERSHSGRATWVWDQPSNRLAQGHLCYSESVHEFLEDWPKLTPERQPQASESKRTSAPATGVDAMSLFGSHTRVTR